MQNFFLKKNRYEIIAILREEFRIKSILEFGYNDLSWKSTILLVDSSCFSIECSPPPQLPIPKNSIFYFSVHSNLGRIDFITTLLPTENNSPDNLLCFAIPDSINIIQRRFSPRLNLRDNYQFFCSGRYKNGFTFRYALNDISEGGCSFTVTKSQLNSIRVGGVLENVNINLGEYGTIIVNLLVINVIKTYIEGLNAESDLRVSCMFQYKSNDIKNYMESIMIKLFVDDKIKRKTFYF